MARGAGRWRARALLAAGAACGAAWRGGAFLAQPGAWRTPAATPSAPAAARGTRLQRRAADNDAYLAQKTTDLVSGQSFSRRAQLLFESERPIVQALLIVLAGIAFSGTAGLLYNVIGEIALLTSPGAKPGMDSEQGLLIQALGVILGVGGFVSLSERRTKSLRSIDAELDFAQMEAELMDGMRISRRLADMKRKRRVVVLYGEGEELAKAVRKAQAYRRRWLTSDTVVICVGDPPQGMAGRWLAKATSPEAWMRRVANFREATEQEGSYEGAQWILLGRSGRVRGQGPVADWDEVLAFVGVSDNLSTLDARAPGDGDAGDLAEAKAAVLKVHDSFYDALIEGKNDVMMPLWVPSSGAKEGRVPWSSVLSDAAEVLAVVDVDVVFTEFASDGKPTEATVTSIEVCPGNPSLFNEGGPDGKGTLLATKRLTLDAAGEWRLTSHQTIPYCRNTLAFQALRCNEDGCVLYKNS